MAGYRKLRFRVPGKLLSREPWESVLWIDVPSAGVRNLFRERSGGVLPARTLPDAGVSEAIDFAPRDRVERRNACMLAGPQRISAP
jgi:hypothetical protein